MPRMAKHHHKITMELIPHDAPMIGHMDDAILVEASWRSLRTEIESYTDYRRLRKLEADLQGKDLHEFRYNRQNWLESREAELVVIKNQRERGLSSFCSNVEFACFMCIDSAYKHPTQPPSFGTNIPPSLPF